MSWTRERIEGELRRIVAVVFGLEEAEVAPHATFAGDLVAESLDYVDLELHISGTFGLDFRFSDHVDALRTAAAGPVRVNDLTDQLVNLLAKARP